MSKQGDGMKKVVNIIVWVAVVLVLVGAMGGIITLMSNLFGSSGDEKFSVTYDGNTYYADTEYDDLRLPQSGTVDFTVNNGGDYTVGIYVKEDTSLTYTVDSVTYYWGGVNELDDITDCFNIEIGETLFTITCDDTNDGYSVEYILSCYYTDAVINWVAGEFAGSYFTLKIVSEEGEEIMLDINFYPEITDVEIESKDGDIVF